MIIDIYTHILPDAFFREMMEKILKSTIEKLCAELGITR